MKNNYLQKKPIGHNNALQIFLDCWLRNQLHHAWLLQGEKGIGKAKVAHYISRFILAKKYPNTQQEESLFASEVFQNLTMADMDITEDNPDIKLYYAKAHPNFIHLEKKIDAGKMQSAITVEAIRNLSQQLMKTSAEGYRIILVDAIDDLNRNAANAILKILEEPPKHTLFLLVSHNPNKLLPTIISRCRRLSFYPLNQQDMKKVITAHDFLETPTMNMQLLLWLANGAVGRALHILSDEGQNLWNDLLEVHRNIVKGNLSPSLTFCNIYGKKNKQEEETLFNLLIELYLHLLQARIFISVSYNENIPKLINELFYKEKNIDLSCWDEAMSITKQILNGDIDRIVGLNRLLLLHT